MADATVQRLPDPDQWVDKQLRNIQAVGQQNYAEGVLRPRKNPIEAGIAAQPAYEHAMRDPEVLRRRVLGLQRTSMNEWATRSVEIGAGRLVEGVMARQDKIRDRVRSYHALLSQHLQRIDAMPSTTDADRIRRMVANVEGLKAMKGKV